MVGFGKSGGIGQGEAKGREGNAAGDDIDEVVLAVSEQGSAAYPFTVKEFGPGEAGLGEYGNDEGPDGPRLRGQFRGANFGPTIQQMAPPVAARIMPIIRPVRISKRPWP